MNMRNQKTLSSSERMSMGNNSNMDSSSSEEETSDEEDIKPLPSTEITIVIKNKKTQQDELFQVLLDSGTN